jgi:hypothetical protein
MSEQQKERFYTLLPTIYRQRDEEQGGALRAMMAALESEFRALESDIDTLYANWFIDTCEEWAIPYIAELLGVYPPGETAPLFPTQRRQVANTIAYRRRKGSPAILEQVIRDVSGWYVCAVEYRQLLAITQHLSNLQPQRGRTLDLHPLASLAALEGPFDTAAHTIDIRGAVRLQNFRSLPGKYDSNALGLFVWRLQSYLLTNVPATVITRNAETGRFLAAGCFTFDPLGRTMPLFHQPQQLTSMNQRTEAVNLPVSLSRTAFAEDLTTYRARHSTKDNEDLTDLNSNFYGPDRSLCIFVNGNPLGPRQVLSVDLSQWNVPRSNREEESTVGIDVESGRFAFLGNGQWHSNTYVAVNYCYGFYAELGGGPYSRATSVEDQQQGESRVNVLQGGKVSSLKQALALWQQYCEEWKPEQHQGVGPHYTICIVDNGVYWEDDLVFNVPPFAHLSIAAADGVRPVIRSHNPITINSMHADASLRFSGLLIESKLALYGNITLQIDHCTLMPYGIEAQTTDLTAGVLQLAINASIVGSVKIAHGKGSLTIRGSVLDAATGYALDTLHTGHIHTGYRVTLERTTIFGKVRLQELQSAQDVIFTDTVTVVQQQSGRVSFSYVPTLSQTPLRERCQPDLAASRQPGQEIYPLFSSVHYGDPAYAQLSAYCAQGILRGASDGAEMGVFHDSRTAQRLENIQHALDEYMPFGLNESIFYMT